LRGNCVGNKCKKKMQNLGIEFTDKKISPWGGIHLFHNIYSKMEMRKIISSLPLPSKGSNRSLEPVDIIESFMVGVVLGARRLAHNGMLRSDDVIKEIFGWKHSSPSASTYSRFFQKWDVDLNDQFFPAVQEKIFEHVGIKRITIDIDSTVITRYGTQEKAAKGYNPEKRGAVSHHPIMAFCDELKLLLNAWMRGGDSNSSSEMEDFLDELFTIVARDRIGLIRMDSGFYNKEIISKLQNADTKVDYLIKAKMTTKLLGRIYEQTNWHSAKKENSPYEYSEFDYKGQGWGSAQRMVVCRRKRTQEEKLSTGHLFPDLEEKESYHYYAFVTSLTLGCEEIHKLYNGRGDCENIIKELKYDYGIDGFALQGFYPMEAAFRMTMIAYNIMVLLRENLRLSKNKTRLSTMRFQCIALGSFVVTNGRNRILKLAARGKRRHFLEKIFEKVDLIPPNFQISNA